MIVFDGTRGDTQPYLLAAKALMKADFDVMVTGPGDAGQMAQEFQVPFTRSRLSAQKVFADPEMAKVFATDDVTKVLGALDKKKDEFLTESSREKDLEALCTLIQEWKPDLILAGAVLLALVIMVSKVHRVPVVSFTLAHGRVCKTLKPMYMPDWLPKFMWWPLWRVLVFAMARSEFKQSGPALSKLLGVPMAQLRCTANEMSRYLSANATFLSIIATSPAVHGDLPQDFNGNNVQIGALMMPLAEEQGINSFGSEEVQAMQEFLDSGSAPVYFGFGSIICHTSKFMTLLCLRALRLTGERGILCRGWSTMCLDDLQGEADEEDLKAYCHEKVLFVDKAPHGWLFPKCQVVVHHGGAGTLHASARSGRPTLIAQIFGDQPAHAVLVNERGFGLSLKSMPKATPLELADTIRKCINTPSIHAKAKEVAEQMKKEDASARLVEVIKGYMESHIRTGKHMKTLEELEQKKGGCLAGCCACYGSSGASSSNY